MAVENPRRVKANHQVSDLCHSKVNVSAEKICFICMPISLFAWGWVIDERGSVLL